MGLCKCPKRKVTNQFCFEHRVNVCEHCMVTNHPKCVIQSYIQWLQDSDCNPICTFCNETLVSRECCRLTCYHVYHWGCLDAHCRSLPESTNAANYDCPTCNTHIIPQPNLVSPVADVLREKLNGVNWARLAQGLPLLSFDREEKPNQMCNVMESDSTQSTSYQNHVSTSLATSRASSIMTSPNTISNNAANQKLGPPYSVVNMESPSVMSNNPTARRVFEAYDDPKDFSFDHDENKYQRKSAIEWFLRWWKMITRTPAPRRNPSGSLHKRYATLVIIGIFLFVIIIMLFSWLGRMATDGDPSYDPMNNPMIRVGNEHQSN
ncbi:zinc finger protein-like 1 [Phymastichus coffea]|uniref:zinc finger protein-like 1 n=1 Tax=Phymastichus coffea TaxID=108790 RepID=UPI00273A8615|nr:zinc finger protein-like 1 [Phymastichus coffea]XP_058808485.1 zinc finger protein-like 1 [Phymastichus coffea]XP_058808486.1 zinc finger protein-like 1 [Phymastichus coffea]XP_058808487.1 zinc finger protein-like 1 [Phymastichus coffea]